MNAPVDTRRGVGKSGRELAESEKPSKTRAPRPGRGSARYWETKVYRMTWIDDNGAKREGTDYFARISFGGRRSAVALHTSHREEAGRRAARLYDRIRTAGWDKALAEHDPERRAPRTATTIGDVAKTLESAGLRPRTAANYVQALRWWGARVLGVTATRVNFGHSGSAEMRERIHAVRLDQLSEIAVRKVITQFMAEAGKDQSRQRVARINLASFARNARAGFTAAAKAGIELPTPRPLDGVKIDGAKPQRYVSTINPPELLRQAREELSSDPDAFATILLAIGAGLRRAEIEHLRWSSVDRDGQRILVVGDGDWTPKTDDSSGEVHVNAGLIALLEPRRAGPDDYVVRPGAADRAVAWLRGRGVQGDKPLHTLRKEFGSIVCQQADLLTASRQLRHSSLAVTAGVYIESRQRAAPDIGSMLH